MSVTVKLKAEDDIYTLCTHEGAILYKAKGVFDIMCCRRCWMKYYVNAGRQRGDW